MRRTLTLLILAIAVPVSAFAQQSGSGRAVAPTAVAPRPPAVDQSPRAGSPASTRVDPNIDTSDVNISITVTITDKSSAGTQTKTVSLLFANQASGRVRSSGSTSYATQAIAGGTMVPTENNRSSELNVDAGGTLMKSGQIKTNLTINYAPEWADEKSKMTGVQQSVFSLYLKDGQPTMITQAADPTKGTRSVAIEVTAKVVK